ncbi:MAG: GNAT family N-acetyltransferase [Psychromonas sp.]
MVEIEKMHSGYLQQVNDLGVSTEQLHYVETLQAILANDSDFCHVHVILDNEVVVGLFLIDTSYAKKYDFCGTSSIGLRSFFISTQYQGRGFAKKGMLALMPYLAINYQQYNYIYLTVNCENLAAYHCYLAANFDDTGTTYLGGLSGPQHIMRAQITTTKT